MYLIWAAEILENIPIILRVYEKPNNKLHQKKKKEKYRRIL